MRDKVEEGDWAGAQEQVVKVAGLVESAARKLLDELALEGI